MVSAIGREDYEEPRCPLCTPASGTPIPVGRVIGKLDEHLNKQDYDAAERHLKYWLNEADAVGDGNGKLTVMQELIGLYRKTGRQEEALCFADAAPALAEALGQDDSAGMGTVLLNAATAYKAFGQAEKALPLYERAQKLYERHLPKGDARFGGLYNNMALALMDLKEYERADDLLQNALAVMAQTAGGEPERAVTYCNLADLAEARYGLEDAEEQIGEYLNAAMALLDSPAVLHDGNYAYVCEKCASAFGYHGYFWYEVELLDRARSIYERT